APPGRRQRVEPGLPVRRDGEGPRVRGAGKVPLRPDEWPRDDASYEMLAIEQASGEPAKVPELLRRPDILVCRDLKDRISRRVEDRAARREVFRAELLDDLGARGRSVAQHLPARVPLERLDDL